jgi:hypothetical protein
MISRDGLRINTLRMGWCSGFWWKARHFARLYVARKNKVLASFFPRSQANSIYIPHTVCNVCRQSTSSLLSGPTIFSTVKNISKAKAEREGERNLIVGARTLILSATAIVLLLAVFVSLPLFLSFCLRRG